MAAESAPVDDDWELFNDNGFVYKRRRRSLAEDPPDAPPPSDSDAAHRRLSRRRRKQCLLKLRDKYRRELDHWEQLSSSLIPSPPPPPPPPDPSAAPPPPTPPPPPHEHLLDELILQVEAQEAMLRKLSELCCYIDSLCEAEEERVAQELLDLPIWGSPRSLIASLSTDAENLD